MIRARVLAIATLSSVLLLGQAAWAHGPTRQKVVETIDIDAPAAEVWAIIKDFDTAHTWLPMVESSTGEGGNEPGATRVLTLGPDVEVYETLKKYNAEKMKYSYRIPDKTHDVSILPVNNYSSTISVSGDGEQCVVTWKGAFYRGYPNNDPPEDLNEAAAIAAVSGLYQAGLQHLKQMVESQ